MSEQDVSNLYDTSIEGSLGSYLETVLKEE
jgi:hypothetical protein